MARSEGRNGLTSLLEDLSPALRKVASREVGIVTTLEECLADVQDPPLIRVSCEIADGRELIGTPLGHAAGIGGSGFSRAAAASAAVGEAVERYSGSFLPLDRFVHASARELGGNAVDPASFALFADEQYARPGFRFERFTEDTPVHWVEGTELGSGARVWLPVELVYLGDVVEPGGKRIAYATSSGMACAEGPLEATERGLLELLERDAFVLAWNRRISPPRLAWSANAQLQALEDDYFRPTGLEYTALDLSACHGLPIVLAVVRGAPGAGGALGVGAAAAFEIERAWWKALSEAFASRSAGHKLSLLRPQRRFANPDAEVLSFEDHIQYYADPARAAAAEFLTASPERRDASEITTSERLQASERIDFLVERISRAGSSSYAVDVTAPDVADAGLTVIKTLAPKLCALDVLHGARFLGSRRLVEASCLRDMSERDTLTTGPRRVEDLNPDPHPFP